MATKCTIKFYEDHSGVPTACVELTMDGYVSGVGHDLAKWLLTKQMKDPNLEGFANGIDCLAAQFVAEHKKGAYGLYLVKPDTVRNYNYRVYKGVDGGFIIECGNIFTGTPSEFLLYEED